MASRQIDPDNKESNPAEEVESETNIAETNLALDARFRDSEPLHDAPSWTKWLERMFRGG